MCGTASGVEPLKAEMKSFFHVMRHVVTSCKCDRAVVGGNVPLFADRILWPPSALQFIIGCYWRITRTIHQYVAAQRATVLWVREANQWPGTGNGEIGTIYGCTYSSIQKRTPPFVTTRNSQLPGVGAVSVASNRAENRSMLGRCCALPKQAMGAASL